jgi:hypothetical protein
MLMGKEEREAIQGAQKRDRCTGKKGWGGWSRKSLEVGKSLVWGVMKSCHKKF